MDDTRDELPACLETSVQKRVRELLAYLAATLAADEQCEPLPRVTDQVPHAASSGSASNDQG